MEDLFEEGGQLEAKAEHVFQEEIPGDFDFYFRIAKSQEAEQTKAVSKSRALVK